MAYLSLYLVPFEKQVIFFFKILFYFLERGEGRQGEKHQHVVASHVPPTREPAHKPGICPGLGIEPATLWFAGWHSVH